MRARNVALPMYNKWICSRRFDAGRPVIRDVAARFTWARSLIQQLAMHVGPRSILPQQRHRCEAPTTFWSPFHLHIRGHRRCPLLRGWRR